MKTILKSSIATSLLLLCLSLSVFAEGDQGAGSKTGSNGSELATTINTQIDINGEKSEHETVFSFLNWISAQFAETFDLKF